MPEFQVDEDTHQLTYGAAIDDVAAADAAATYGAGEAALVNELKAKLNAVLAVMRNAGLMQQD